MSELPMHPPIAMASSSTPIVTAALLLACTLGPKTNADDTASIVTTSGLSSDTGITATGITPTSEASTTSASTSGAVPGTTATSATTDEDSGTFIVTHDMGPTPPICDLALQDCPEGQKCNPSTIGCQFIFCGQPICVPLTPDARPPGSPCSLLGDANDGTDDCKLGSVCLFSDDRGNGTCHQICEANYTELPACTKPGDLCFHPGCQECSWGYCDVPCDPREPDACDPGEVCIGQITQLICVLDASGEEGQVGDGCEFANACDPGLLCVNAIQIPGCGPETSGCCTPYCSTDLPNTCPNKAQGEVCLPLFTAEDEPPLELANLGLCSLPP